MFGHCERCGIQWPGTSRQLWGGLVATLCNTCCNEWHRALIESPLWQDVLQFDGDKATLELRAHTSPPAAEEVHDLRRREDELKRAGFAFALDWMKAGIQRPSEENA